MAINNDLESCRFTRIEQSVHERFWSALPGELNDALGDRIEDLRPRWARGTSRLVVRLLAKHLDEFADRDLSLALGK